jgi:nitrate reductase gamma subunit
MRALTALLLVVLLAAVAGVGAGFASVRGTFGWIVPYAALFLMLGGLTWRVAWWARSPVPFRIPTTCGQHTTFDWIRPDRLDNPQSTLAVAGRLTLEVLLFRSLFRNTSSELHSGPKLAYGPNRWLWFASLLFHYSLLVILIRHLRLFTEPVPGAVVSLVKVDAFLDVGIPPMSVTTVTLPLAVTYLLMRRVLSARLRSISRVSDYFPLLLLLAIGTSGLLLRHALRSDLVAVKAFCLSLAAFEPMRPDRLPWLFFTHLALVCVLFAYLPFSKLVHLGGVLLSPTRNLANNSRKVRHVNPWAQPAKLHSYEAYEDMFRDKMVRAGVPVDKGASPVKD